MRRSLYLARIALGLGLGWGAANAIACSSASKGLSSAGDDAAGDVSDASGAVSGDPSGGPSSGSGAASSSGSGSGSGSRSGSSSGSPSSGAGAGTAADGGVSSSACTHDDCDSHACTVCVPQNGGLDAATCEPGATAVCGNNAATFHCASIADCASDEVCCGSFNLSAFSLTTACQKGSCPAALPLCSSGTQCQLCKHDSECGNSKCVDQNCNGSEVHFCALNSLCTAL